MTLVVDSHVGRAESSPEIIVVTDATRHVACFP
jgi:hypothetical protein